MALANGAAQFEYLSFGNAQLTVRNSVSGTSTCDTQFFAMSNVDGWVTQGGTTAYNTGSYYINSGAHLVLARWRDRTTGATLTLEIWAATTSSQNCLFNIRYQVA